MMTQTDFIRQEIEALRQRKDDLGWQIKTAVHTLNIVNRLIRSKKRQLREFERYEKRREAYERIPVNSPVNTAAVRV